MSWAGTQRGINYTVTGILSKELPNETIDIFCLSLAIEAVWLFII